MFVLFYLLMFVLLCCFFFPIWGYNCFGDIDLEKILFNIYVPLKNPPMDWTDKIYIPICLTLISFVLLIVLGKQLKKHKICTGILCVMLLVFDIFYINKHYGIIEYAKNCIASSKFIEDNYVNPSEVKISFPKQKKNLIFIQAESLESSLQDKKNGGFFDENYIPHLTKLAKENLSFSHSDLIEGAAVLPSTGWTIAGLVAETAGLPLKLYGKSFKDIDNSMSKYTTFLPGAVSLGDILEKNNYKNVFILGTAGNFAGQRNYLKSHGNYKIYDKKDMKLSEDPKAKQYENQSDLKVLEFSKEKILELAKGKAPFNVMIQTYDNHMGHMNPQYCERKYDQDFKNGYICMDTLLDDFVNWAKKQDFYKNTTIVILGDHCSMSNAVAAGVEKIDGKDLSSRHAGNIKRKVYNVFINPSVSPVSAKDRKFSTMDMFPTMLASIGAKIEGDRLGLGVNLFSDQKTLPEKYGYDYIFDELKKKSFFYNNNLLY